MAKATFLLFLGAIFTAQMSWSASFDCSLSTLNTVEKKICLNSQVSDLDSHLGELYRSIHRLNFSRLYQFDTAEIKSSQRIWMADRNKCETEDCLVMIYKSRVKEINEYLDSTLRLAGTSFLEGIVTGKDPDFMIGNKIENIVAFRISPNNISEYIFFSYLTQRNESPYCIPDFSGYWYIQYDHEKSKIVKKVKDISPTTCAEGAASYSIRFTSNEFGTKIFKKMQVESTSKPIFVFDFPPVGEGEVYFKEVK